MRLVLIKFWQNFDIFNKTRNEYNLVKPNCKDKTFGVCTCKLIDIDHYNL